ncbi:cell division cycle- protein [Tulasnella sp. 427]|nr:cell division cycle- protein [Tulasnella sp. 427]
MDPPLEMRPSAKKRAASTLILLACPGERQAAQQSISYTQTPLAAAPGRKNPLLGEYDDHLKAFHIIDCCLDYEFEGGHIEGATNFTTPEEAADYFLDQLSVPPPSSSGDPSLNGKFHCGFSAEHGPTFAKHCSHEAYPRVHYLEIHIFQGGYRSYWESHPHRCRDYTKMDDPNHSQEDRHYEGWERTRSHPYGESTAAITSLSNKAAASAPEGLPQRLTSGDSTSSFSKAASRAPCRPGVALSTLVEHPVAEFPRIGSSGLSSAVSSLTTRSQESEMPRERLLRLPAIGRVVSPDPPTPYKRQPGPIAWSDFHIFRHDHWEYHHDQQLPSTFSTTIRKIKLVLLRLPFDPTGHLGLVLSEICTTLLSSLLTDLQLLPQMFNTDVGSSLATESREWHNRNVDAGSLRSRPFPAIHATE